MIPPQGTYDYVGTVPEAGALPWTIELRIATDRRDPALPIAAGPRPWLKVDEAGLTPNPGYQRGIWRPEVLRARLRICAGLLSAVASARAERCVDLGLFRCLRAGDVLHLSGTPCGGFGMSALRDGQLVYAVGAITAVPLGEGNSARHPGELIAEAQAAFRRRDPGFSFEECPLELCLAGRTLLLPGSHSLASVDDYTVHVFNGFRPGVPGVDVSAAVSRKGLCSDTAPSASAQLLRADRRASSA